MIKLQLNSFNPKDSLNPFIWYNDSLSLDVSLKLKRIVSDFMESSGYSKNLIRDIIIAGSLANYNWSNLSDIDLHIIIDFKDIDDNVKLVKDFFNSKKIEWNKTHDIRIKNHEVEIYVQDVNENLISSGVYSVSKDSWITKPIKEQPRIDISEVKRKSLYLMKEIDEAAKMYKEKKYKESFAYSTKLREKLAAYRKGGLEAGGEYSLENLVFKTLRRNGYLEKLGYVKNFSYDKMMSLDESGVIDSGQSYSGGWNGDDPTGWTNLRNSLIEDYPGSEISAVYDPKTLTLRIYKISVPKEQRGQGIGSEIIEHITDWADDTQTVLLLTPSTDYGATSVSRLIKFYKRFGFIENSGRKRNFEYSDRMYRQPQ